MLNLLLCRHSKSSWDFPYLRDIDRPLSKRGYNDAKIIGQVLLNQNVKPDLIVSSPAIRAFHTARIYAGIMDMPYCKIKIIKELYFNMELFFHDLSRYLKDDVKSVMLVSHNPDIHTFAEEFTGQAFNKIPTSAVINISFSNERWADICKKSSKVVSFDYPKKYK